MPAKNPRLTITLTPGFHALLRRMSTITGNSQSAIVSELLEGTGPALERVLAVLEAAVVAKDSIRGQLAADMEQAQSRIEQQLGLSLEVYEDASRPLVEQAEAIRRRARKGGTSGTRSGPVEPSVSGASTPPSNRGVRSTPKTSKTSTRTRG